MLQLFKTLRLYGLPKQVPDLTRGLVSCKIWIILSEKESDDSEMLEFLLKILQAIHVDLNNDVYQITYSNQPFYLYNLLRSDTQEKTILCFGIAPKNLGMTIIYQPYKSIRLRNHRFLFADTLTLINSDPTKKRALWEILQKINFTK